ncbi:MAG: TonB-dependent receptor [Gammaproteobacteria bacterium]|nr:TonB-dependent receptor [Gammaproteobacteria bacterium]
MKSLLYLAVPAIALASAASNWESPVTIGTPSTETTVATSALPVVIFDRDDLVRTGYDNLNEALASLLPGYSYPRPSVADGSSHAQPGSFRGFAPDQVAYRLNGRPLQPSAQYHRAEIYGHGSLGVDLTMLPLAAIKRIEVLRDGASDMYGSGAIGGVVNIVLDDASEGGTLIASYGLHRTSVDGVPKFFGFVPISDSEFQLFEGIGRPQAIDDGDGATWFFSGSWGFEFFDDGYLRIAAQYRDQDATQRAGLDPRPQYPALPNGDYDPREAFVDRRNHQFGNADQQDAAFLLNAAIPITEHIAFEGHFGIATRNARSADLFRRPVDERNVPEIYPDGFLPGVKSDIDHRLLSLGFVRRGSVWDWEFALVTKEDEIDWRLAESINTSFGTLSPTGFSTGNNEGRNQNIFFEVGRAVTLADRPGAFRAGIEYLATEYENEIGGFASFANGGATGSMGEALEIGSQGKVGIRPVDDFDVGDDSMSVYGQFALDPTDTVNLVLGARYTEHSEAGSFVSPRVAARWAISDSVAVRGTISRNYRAPGLAQAHFTESRTVMVGSELREEGIYGIDTAPALALGSAPLDFEKSVNLTVGLQFQPNDTFIFSIDAYRVELDDRIVLSDNLTGTAVQGVPGTDTAGVESARFSFNGIDTRTTGVDASAAYRWDTRAGVFDFDVGLNANDVKVQDVANESYFGRRSILRVNDGTPETKTHLGFRWRYQKMDLGLRARRYGEVVDAGATPDLDHVIAAQWLVDFRFAYALTSRLDLTFGIDNLLDRYPTAKPRNTYLDRILPFSNFSPFGFNGRRMILRFDVGFP